MYSYLFKTPTGIESVDEKTAHMYIKHPSGAQRANLTYLGAILKSEETKLRQEVLAAKKEKFGAIGQGEENDNLIIQSREFTESLIKSGMEKLLETADKTIKPANFDFLYGNINNLENAGHAGSLAEAKQRLITRR
jgi:hypothetical protein